MTGLRRPAVAILMAVAIHLTLSDVARGQDGPDDDPDGAAGLTTSFFEHSAMDSVNLYNGNLTIPIPVGPSYPVGPQLRFQALLAYNSTIWEYGRSNAQLEEGQLYSPLIADPALGIGWSFSAGAIKACGKSQNFRCYVAPDGTSHQFTLPLPAAGGSKTQDASQFFLTGNAANGYEMYDGDGNYYYFHHRVLGYDDVFSAYIHNLGRGRDGWYLDYMKDPFGNRIDVTYYPGQGALPCWDASTVCPVEPESWIPQKITGTPRGLSTPAWTIDIGLELSGSGRIGQLKFALGDGTTQAVWDLEYAALPITQAEPNATSVSAIGLTTIRLPGPVPATRPTYVFTYQQGQTGYMGGGGGLLRTMTLPTGGKITYAWGTYTFYHPRRGAFVGGDPNCQAQAPPSGSPIVAKARMQLNQTLAPVDPGPGLSGCDSNPTIPDPVEFRDEVNGVIRRSETVGGTTSSTDYVQISYPFGERRTATDPECLSSPMPPNEPKGCSQTLTLVIYPRGIDGQLRATGTLFWSASTAKDGTPFPGDRIGADIETRIYDFDPYPYFPTNPPSFSSPACGSGVNLFCSDHAIRVTQRDFDYDNTGEQKFNRRVKREKTFHHPLTAAGTCGVTPCRYTETVYETVTPWEDNGRHYDLETHNGTLAEGGALQTRTIQTDWEPAPSWTAGPAAGPLLPNLIKFRHVTEGVYQTQNYFEFDPGTGFLKGTVAWDSVADVAYVQCAFPTAIGADPFGNGTITNDLITTIETTSVPNSASTYCSDHYSASSSVGDGRTFGRRYTYSPTAEVNTVAWKSGTTPVSWKTTFLSRDATTGWVKTSTDTANLSTSFDRDQLGRVTSVTPPGETPTNITYDDTNRTATAARNGGTGLDTWVQYEFDQLGRLKRQRKTVPGQSGPITVKQYIHYDAAGHDYFHSEWVPNGASDGPPSLSPSFTCRYSNAGIGETTITVLRPTTAPGTFSTCFDPFGRPQKVEGAALSSIITSYRTDGPSLHSDSKDTVTNYCVNGYFAGTACTSVGTVSNPVTVTLKDAFGRVTKVTEPTGDVTTYAYDNAAHVANVAQGVQNRFFVYDAAGQLRREQTPEGKHLTYYYGGLRNLLKQEHRLTAGDAPDLTTNYSYDFAGRVTSLQAGGQTYVANCYDGAAGCGSGNGGQYDAGKLTGQIGYNPSAPSAPTVTRSLFYDGLGGRLSSRQTTITGGVPALSTVTEKWAFNTLGLVSDYWHPRVSTDRPFVVSTAYAQALPVTVYANGVPMVRSVWYQNSGSIASYTTGAGLGYDVTTALAPDSSGLPRPSSITADRGTTRLFDTGIYNYDGVGNIVKVGADTFTYDDVARLTAAAYSGLGTQYYCYDRWNNRTAKGLNVPPTCPAAWGDNKVPGAFYDTRGNITTYAGESYLFDYLGRQYRHTGGGTWNYAFDGGGERLVRIPASPLQWTYTFRDEGNRLSADYVGGSPAVPSRDQLYLGNLLVATYANMAVNSNGVAWTFYSSDHLGTPRILTDVGGAVLDTRKYWPYGDEAAGALTSPERTRFAAAERDTEASRYWLHARTHDFSLGRFMSADRAQGWVADPQSWNRYAYSLSNPMNVSDPKGLSPCGMSIGDEERGRIPVNCHDFVGGTKEERDAAYAAQEQLRQSLSPAVKTYFQERFGVDLDLELQKGHGTTFVLMNGSLAGVVSLDGLAGYYERKFGIGYLNLQQPMFEGGGTLFQATLLHESAHWAKDQRPWWQFWKGLGVSEEDYTRIQNRMSQINPNQLGGVHLGHFLAEPEGYHVEMMQYGDLPTMTLSH